jgi:hypothetical protein
MTVIAHERIWAIYAHLAHSTILADAIVDCGEGSTAANEDAVEYVRADLHQGAVDLLRDLARMPLRATGRDYDRLVKAAREMLPEYGAEEAKA